MRPSAVSTSRVNAVLLASAAPLRDELLTASHQALLKTALDRPGAAIALTGSGEFLGMFDVLDLALDAALSFLQAADGLEVGGRSGGFAGRAVLEVWPENADQLPVERVREILGQAQPHGLLLTAECSLLLPPARRAELMPYYPKQELPSAKGVMELPWREGASTYREKTLHVSGRSLGSAQQKALRLSRRGLATLVRPDDCPFTVGRDSACAMSIGGPNVSRLHGAIVHEAGRFHFRDDSRNGTYLTTSGSEVFVHSDRFPLLGDGVISPGSPLVEQTGEVIRYASLDTDPGD